MRLLLAVAAWAALAAGTGALAQNAPARLDDPKVTGQPIDHCADIDGNRPADVPPGSIVRPRL